MRRVTGSLDPKPGGLVEAGRPVTHYALVSPTPPAYTVVLHRPGIADSWNHTHSRAMYRQASRSMQR